MVFTFCSVRKFYYINVALAPARRGSAILLEVSQAGTIYSASKVHAFVNQT
jgi:hypothetical protein